MCYTNAALELRQSPSHPRWFQRSSTAAVTRLRPQAPPPSPEAFERARVEGTREAECRLREFVAKVQARDRQAGTAVGEAAIQLDKAASAIREPIDVELGESPPPRRDRPAPSRDRKASIPNRRPAQRGYDRRRLFHPDRRAWGGPLGHRHQKAYKKMRRSSASRLQSASGPVCSWARSPQLGEPKKEIWRPQRESNQWSLPASRRIDGSSRSSSQCAWRVQVTQGSDPASLPARLGASP